MSAVLRRRYGHLFGFGAPRDAYTQLMLDHGGRVDASPSKIPARAREGRWDAHVSVLGHTLLGDGATREAAVRDALLQLPAGKRHLFSRGAEW